VDRKIDFSIDLKICIFENKYGNLRASFTEFRKKFKKKIIEIIWLIKNIAKIQINLNKNLQNSNSTTFNKNYKHISRLRNFPI